MDKKQIIDNKQVKLISTKKGDSKKPTTKKIPKKRKKKDIPVNNKELYGEIVLSKAQGKLTPRALILLMLIADGVSRKLPYIKIADKEDCASSAKLDLLKYWAGFNPIYKNAFAYYTEIAKKGAAKGWNKLYPKKYAGTISLDSTGYGSDSSDGVYSI
jgi:hypothetical protein